MSLVSQYYVKLCDYNVYKGGVRGEVLVALLTQSATMILIALLTSVKTARSDFLQLSMCLSQENLVILSLF